MSWKKELDELLLSLQVEQEHESAALQGTQNTQDPQTSSQHVNFSFTQASASHPGVFCRLDFVESVELRVSVPTYEAPYKLCMYLVTLAPESFLKRLLDLLLSYQGGSVAFQQIEGAVIYHFLAMLMIAMEQLFWQGDLDRFQFPPEIEVRCLL